MKWDYVIYSPEEIEFIYSNTKQTSQLRRLAVEGAIHSHVGELLFDFLGGPTIMKVPGFAVDICSALRDTNSAGKRPRDVQVFRPYRTSAKDIKEYREKAETEAKASDSAASKSNSLDRTLNFTSLATTSESYTRNFPGRT